MRLLFQTRCARLFLAPEHGGSVKGGGHPSDKTVPAEEEILDAMGQMMPARGRVPGTNDPGVPGSRTQTGQDNPLEDESARVDDRPLSHPMG
ncbi:hypothetical protein ACXR0O_00430 [Verrucomicrobiota bacterium sgz303538]